MNTGTALVQLQRSEKRGIIKIKDQNSSCTDPTCTISALCSSRRLRLGRSLSSRHYNSMQVQQPKLTMLICR